MEIFCLEKKIYCPNIALIQGYIVLIKSNLVKIEIS